MASANFLGVLDFVVVGGRGIVRGSGRKSTPRGTEVGGFNVMRGWEEQSLGDPEVQTRGGMEART